MRLRRTLEILSFVGLLLSATVSYAAPDPAEKKTKEEKIAEKEKKADEKNAAQYEKVKDFALNKYKTDPEFRDEVDADFDEVMRDHSSEAFRTNRNRHSQLVSVAEDTWREHFSLYDNLLVQDHINRIGQRLVPAGSEKLYAFRVVPDATPLARTLATGTIYVSTGLISMLDSEAQLAYVLAHEMAHVHLDHWKEKSMMKLGIEEYNAAQQKKAARIGMIGALAGAAIGGAAGKGLDTALAGAALGGVAGFVTGAIMNPKARHVEWDKVQEDQADDYAFKAVINTNYDVREVPKLFLAMDKAASRDSRIQLGFIGQRKRLKQRTEKAEDLLANALKADIEVKAKNGFVSSSAEHRNLMAELKRDNGILAYYTDMFEMARTNLAEAVAIRDNDPAAHYFYAKTLKLVGRTDEELRTARESFFKATKADSRRQNYGAHLHLALMLARERGMDAKQVASMMDTYVVDYARWNAERRALGAYPPNLDSIYEYITLYGGDPNWKPRVPDLKELEIYRMIAEMGAPLPSAQEPAPAPKAVAAEPAKGTPGVIQTVVDTVRGKPAAGAVKRAVQKPAETKK